MEKMTISPWSQRRSRRLNMCIFASKNCQMKRAAIIANTKYRYYPQMQLMPAKLAPRAEIRESKGACSIPFRNPTSPQKHLSPVVRPLQKHSANQRCQFVALKDRDERLSWW